MSSSSAPISFASGVLAVPPNLSLYNGTPSPVSTSTKTDQKGEAAPMPGKLTKADVESRLNESAVKAMKEMTTDTNRRMKGYKASPELLEKGIFYSNEYFLALKALATSDRKMEQVLEEGKKEGVFFHGKAPSEFFDQKKDAKYNSVKGLFPYWYILKKEKMPSDALKAMREGLTFFDCGGICNLAYYQALLDLFGKEKFDVLFPQNSVSPFSTSDNDPDTSLKVLIEKVHPKSPDDFKKGQMCAFSGPQEYHWKHLNGEGANFNVICSDPTANQQKYLGLGLDSEGVDARQIEAALLAEYNKDPIGTDIFDAKTAETFLATYSEEELEIVQSQKNARLELNKFRGLGGGRILLKDTIEFNVERITLLANATIGQSRQLLNLWVKGRKKV